MISLNLRTIFYILILLMCLVLLIFNYFPSKSNIISNSSKIIIPQATKTTTSNRILSTPYITNSNISKINSIPIKDSEQILMNEIIKDSKDSTEEDPKIITLPNIHSKSDFNIKLDLETTIENPKIAFLILVHTHETCQNVQEMIKFLYSPKHQFIIHLDKKLRFPKSIIKDSLYPEKLNNIVDFDPEFSGKSCELSMTLDYPNVHFAENRINVQWGTMSIMEAELEAMKTSLNFEWDYAMIICGSSWPVRTIEVMSHYIKKYFKKDSNMIFWGGKRNPCPDENNTCDRFQKLCVDGRCERKYSLSNNITFYKDFQNLILARSFVKYLTLDQSIESVWKPMFKHIFAPEEAMPHTVLMNHPIFKKSIEWHKQVSDEFMGIVYQSWAGTKCKSHPNPRPCCSPCYLGINDWDDLQTQGFLKQSFFVRKILRRDSLKDLLLRHAYDENALLL